MSSLAHRCIESATRVGGLPPIFAWGTGHQPTPSSSALANTDFVLPSCDRRGDYPASMSIKPLLGDGLVARSVRVRSRDVVYVKGILEASEGIGALFAKRGGELVVATPVSRESALDELLADLVAEIDAVVTAG